MTVDESESYRRIAGELRRALEPEPPAETQQDDPLLPLVQAIVAGELAGIPSQYRHAFLLWLDEKRAALAVRPSADTEALRNRLRAWMDAPYPPASPDEDRTALNDLCKLAGLA